MILDLVGRGGGLWDCSNMKCLPTPDPIPIKFTVSHLRRHITPCADPGVWGNVDLVGLAVEPVRDNIIQDSKYENIKVNVKEPDCEAKVCNCATSVSFHQNVLRLDVPVKMIMREMAAKLKELWDQISLFCPPT